MGVIRNRIILLAVDEIVARIRLGFLDSSATYRSCVQMKIVSKRIAFFRYMLGIAVF